MATTVRSADRVIPQEGKVLRQPLSNRIVHWAIALSTFSLFLTGLPQLPLSGRYMARNPIGTALSGDVGTMLLVHYVGSGILLLVVIYHLVYHLVRRETGLLPRRGDLRASLQSLKAILTRAPEPSCPGDKYLPKQRVTYAFIGANVLLLCLSGIAKIAKNMPSVSMPPEALVTITVVHNAATVLLLAGVVVHIVAVIIPANRKLLPSMFTGKVDVAYAEEHFRLWYESLRRSGL